MAELSLGNGYTIDLADGWTFVHSLEDALRQLRQAWQQNGANLQVPSPGNDAHSRNFSQSMTQQAVHAHQEWFEDQVTKMGAMINNASAMLHQYGIAETENNIKWGAGDIGTPGSQSSSPQGGRRAI
jgi:hypothetical protein